MQFNFVKNNKIWNTRRRGRIGTYINHTKKLEFEISNDKFCYVALSFEMSTIIIAFNNTDKKDDIAFNISPEPSMEAVPSSPLYYTTPSLLTQPPQLLD